MRSICVVTGTRADYGLLYWLLHALHHDTDICLQLVVTGSHLEEKFGHTINNIKNDIWPISYEIFINLYDDTPRAIAHSMGKATQQFGDCFSELQPDIVVILGDRYEMLCAAQVALIHKIAIAHIHGGELTEGAVDDAMRHAITKMAHIHFCAHDLYRKRIIQLGEQAENIYNVGAVGLEHLDAMPHISQDELELDLGLSFHNPLFLVTFHPETLNIINPAVQMNIVCEALQYYSHATIIFTMYNADAYASKSHDVITAFIADKPDSRLLVASLGQQRYLNLMRLADCVIGNSSSGILEAPSCGTPTINIGIRQQGRVQAPSVINAAITKDDIVNAIAYGLSDDMQQIIKQQQTPFKTNAPSKTMLNILKNISLDDIIIKKFYDINHDN